MKILILILLLFLFPVFVFPAFLQLSPSARLASVSDISALEQSPSSIFYNPAVFNKKISLSSSYFMPFSISDLSYKNLVAGYRWRKFSFAFGFQEFGNEIFKEQTGILTTNINIIQNFTLGLSYRLLLKNVYTMQDKNASQFDVGMMANVGKLQFFSSFLNIGFSKIGNDNLPQESRTGISYQIYENLKTGICFVKELDYPFSFHFGTVYYPYKTFGILSGFQTEPERFSFGVEFKVFNLQINYGIKTHQCLELTHYFTICYQ
ncbi:MAG: hypothetical protein ISS28_03925 [Candidatus Cloacimonetes bacterium]|nr:hypothetical protein [Candidatus Cloacimonadota bacterium]MBL7086234.1 hypothetical protein [Candidatus Cloacimonadota bacterium]